MLAGVLFASITLVYLRGGSTEKLRDALGASLKPIAGILLIIAGGGAFQEILVKAKVGDAIVHLTQHFALPALLLGWLIAMLLSVSTGSATVGIVGAAGLLAPLATADPSLNLPLLALAIGSGSGEGVLWHDDGRSHQDDIRDPVHRRACRVGHGASHELVSGAAGMISPGKEIWLTA
jgi:H+/gluconate symporter-like permease